MNFTLHDPTGPSQGLGKGMLRVIVPHWAAEVSIFDGELKPVLLNARVKNDDTSSTGCSMEAELLKGLYQVRINLEGATSTAWAPIEEGQVTEVGSDGWKDLKFTSSSPIHDIANFDQLHTDRAAEQSLSTTWVLTGPKGNVRHIGPCRLFLFVRSSRQVPSVGFCDGLQLLDSDGNLLTDFSSGTKLNAQEGWMSFCADLPAGGYILRRGRAGVLLRFQPLTLCEGWETQVFLTADKFPSLSTWSIHMAAKGSGFRPDDSAALAAEAITDSLRYATSDTLLLQNQNIERSLETLLDAKLRNPWLGVLGAFAILQLLELKPALEARQISSSDSDGMIVGEKIATINRYGRILEDKVIPFLRESMRDHPDVRVLHLSVDQPPEVPFTFPPTLLTAVQRVRTHAVRHPATIPIESLTDRAVDNLVFNSPWTAWRSLAKASGPRDLSTPVAKEITGFSVSSVLSRTAVPRTPVFRFPRSGSTDSSSATDAVLKDATMIQKAKEVVLKYSQDFRLEDLPEQIRFNSKAEITKVLDQTSAEDVSQAFGISLSRTQETISGLKYRVQTSSNDPAAPPSPPSTQIQQAVLEVALSNFGRTESRKHGGSQAAPKFQIREMVARTQGEADRLILACSAEAASQRSAEKNESLKTIADKLYAAARKLLKYGDFVTITGEKGRVLYSNGSFVLLVSPHDRKRVKLSPSATEKYRSKATAEWEKLLRPLGVGLQRVTSKLQDRSWSKWVVNRTDLQDEAMPDTRLYLNLMRLEGVSPIAPEQLGEIDAVVTRLLLYVPLVIYGSDENRQSYERDIRAAIGNLEKMLVRGSKQ